MKSSNNKTSEVKSLMVNAIVKQWKSDLEFYRDELHFITSLVNNYFIYLIDEKEFPSTSKLIRKLKERIHLCQELLQSTLIYISNIGSQLENEMDTVYSVDDKRFIKLEIKTAVFDNALRSLKRDIFSISKTIMKHENMKRLLHVK